MALLVNNRPNNWIKRHQGLCQGDPLSPALFILATDALSRLLKYAGSLSLVKEFDENIVLQGIRSFFFVNDTILFYAGD